MSTDPKYFVGQTVCHKRFDYRGVIIDVDPVFMHSEAWYQAMAVSRPPRDKPWYHVLVHDATHQTYVAERNLEPDDSGEAINHPAVQRFFDRLESGRYLLRARVN